MKMYQLGDLVTVKGSSRGPQRVLAASGSYVLLASQYGQWTYEADQLEPYKEEVCHV